MAPDWHDLTEDPRKYGFHATLKAPLSLAPGKTEAELLAACEAFAATPRTIPVIRPVVGSISGFIAVVPAEPPAELERLAADCVQREFDSFRAPLTPEDRERRNPSPIDAEATRTPRSLGLSLCHGRFPLPHDADGPARHRAARARPDDAAESLFGARSHRRSRSTGSRYSVRKMPIRDSGSSTTGNFRSRLAPIRIGNPSGSALQPVPNLLHQASAPASSCPYRIVVTGFELHGWRHRVCFHKLRRHPELG